MPEPNKHLDADLTDERIVRFAARWSEVPAEARAKMAEEIAGDRPSLFYRGMLAGLNIGYQLAGAAAFAGHPAQSQAGRYIVYMCKLIVDKEGLDTRSTRPIDL